MEINAKYNEINCHRWIKIVSSLNRIENREETGKGGGKVSGKLNKILKMVMNKK